MKSNSKYIKDVTSYPQISDVLILPLEINIISTLVPVSLQLL